MTTEIDTQQLVISFRHKEDGGNISVTMGFEPTVYTENSPKYETMSEKGRELQATAVRVWSKLMTVLAEED